MDELSNRGRLALASWLTTLPVGTQSTIPKPPREQEHDDRIRLFDPAPGSQPYRDGASVWDVLGEYTLRSSGYTPDRGAVVNEPHLFDEGGDMGLAIHDPVRAARLKEEGRAKRTRTSVKPDALPNLSALAKLPAANQWAADLVTEVITRKLRDGRGARLPSPPPASPQYIGRGVIGYTMRMASPTGGGTRLGPLALARLLADPVKLAAHLDDLEARRQVLRFVPTDRDERLLSASG